MKPSDLNGILLIARDACSKDLQHQESQPRGALTARAIERTRMVFRLLDYLVLGAAVFAQHGWKAPELSDYVGLHRPGASR